jgi:uncharacterized phiE125 gp8 family phage protein
VALILVTPPASEPVSLNEMKLHLRVDHSDEDALIQALITAARQHAETVTRRQLVTATWELREDAFPPGLEWMLPLPPLRSVTSIKYLDENGVEHMFSSANYIVDTASEPGRIVLKSGSSWPGGPLYPANAVRVQFTAGYGDAADVPEPIRAAIKLLVGHLYEHRELAYESVYAARSLTAMEFSADALLWPYRVLRWL